MSMSSATKKYRRVDKVDLKVKVLRILLHIFIAVLWSGHSEVEKEREK